MIRLNYVEDKNNYKTILKVRLKKCLSKLVKCLSKESLSIIKFMFRGGSYGIK